MTPTNDFQIHSANDAAVPATTTIVAVSQTQTVVPASFAPINAFLQSDEFKLDALHGIIAMCDSEPSARVPFDPMVHDFYIHLRDESTVDGARRLHVAIIDSAETIRFCADVRFCADLRSDAVVERRFPLKNEIARYISAMGLITFCFREASKEKGYELLRNILTDDEHYLLRRDASDEEIDSIIQRRVGTDRWMITDDFWLRKSDLFFYDDPVTRFVLNNDVHVEIVRVSEKTIEWGDDDFERCSPLWILSMARHCRDLAIPMQVETRAQLIWIRRFGSDPNCEKVPRKICETYRGCSVVWYKQTNRFEVCVTSGRFSTHDEHEVEARANAMMRLF